MAKLTIDTDTFKRIAKHLVANSEEPKLKISADTATLVGQGITGFSASIITIGKDAASAIEGECDVCFDSTQLNKVSDCDYGLSTTLETDANGAELTITSGSLEVKLPLLHNASEFKGIKGELTSTGTYDYDELIDAIGSVSIASNISKIEYSGENKELIFNSEGSLKIKQGIKASKGSDVDLKNKINLDYFKQSLKGGEGEVDIESNTDKPIKVKYKINKATVEAFIAPIIENDD